MARRMREGSTTEDYRSALSGEGGFGSLGYEWSDKPHRLVYDLCGEVDHLRAENERLQIALGERRRQDEIDEEMARSRQ